MGRPRRIRWTAIVSEHSQTMSILAALRPGSAERAGTGDTRGRPLVVAHRGFSHVAPENTVPALRQAIGIGADLVEVDVRRTADGQLVVLHDRSLQRTTDVGRVWPDRTEHPVEAFTLCEVQALDAGGWMGKGYSGTTIPTLVQVLDLLESTHVGLLLELKEPSRFPGIENDVAQLLGHHPMGRDRRVTVQSFDTDALRRFGRLAPRIQRAVLTKTLPLRPSLLAWATAVNPWHAAITTAYVRRAKLAGVDTFGWTANSAPDIRRLWATGVDAIITDRPDIALRTIRSG